MNHGDTSCRSAEAALPVRSGSLQKDLHAFGEVSTKVIVLLDMFQLWICVFGEISTKVNVGTAFPKIYLFLSRKFTNARYPKALRVFMCFRKGCQLLPPCRDSVKPLWGSGMLPLFGGLHGTSGLLPVRQVKRKKSCLLRM